jgi:murein DD-endopeptidase MepM/ murein hydrolase activator NlpD
VFAGYGPILAAQFDNDGHRFRAVRFTPEGGEPGYFDEQGTSMRRFFLKSPLKFDPVITSNFSRSRLHPVLHEYRAHLGVDYRAPAGAPVVAVANGTVISAGLNGGAGRMVHLRHANGFETEYLHLSSIAVKNGGHVRQGDLIGRVGATGLATAPHLDYRVKRNGAFINPVAAHRAMPPAEPIPQPQMTAFSAERDRVFSSFAPLPSPAVANAARVANLNAPMK